MAVIFALSAQPHLSSDLGTIDLVGRKLMHMAEYALLAALWWRALRTTSLGPVNALWAAIAISLAYAGTDEFHQTFVEGRAGTLSDVGIDAAGIALASLRIRARTHARPAVRA
jgi:VanZ family protein